MVILCMGWGNDVNLFEMFFFSPLMQCLFRRFPRYWERRPGPPAGVWTAAFQSSSLYHVFIRHYRGTKMHGSFSRGMSALLELHYLYLTTWVIFFLWQYHTIMHFKDELIDDSFSVTCNETFYLWLFESKYGLKTPNYFIALKIQTSAISWEQESLTKALIELAWLILAEERPKNLNWALRTGFWTQSRPLWSLQFLLPRTFWP